METDAVADDDDRYHRSFLIRFLSFFLSLNVYTHIPVFNIHSYKYERKRAFAVMKKKRKKKFLGMRTYLTISYNHVYPYFRVESLEEKKKKIR